MSNSINRQLISRLLRSRCTVRTTSATRSNASRLTRLHSFSTCTTNSLFSTTSQHDNTNALTSSLFPHRLHSTASTIEEDDDNTTTNTRIVSNIRNVAIVAHVDHGKTTIVDELLQCASKSTTNNDESTSTTDENTNLSEENNGLVMDCGDLERERGITITSKVTRLDYYSNNNNANNNDQHKHNTINVVDTPGHADFAGEVDRILTMIDGVCLIVDAAEGAMAQTKYVLSRALKRNLKPIVVLNKCDKDDAWTRIENGEVEMELLETFDALGANEEQMDYVTVYASGKAGWATTDMDVARDLALGKKSVNDGDGEVTSMDVLLNMILEHIPAPVITVNESNSNGDNADDKSEEQFAIAATTVGYDNFLGRLCTGRIHSGTIQKGDTVTVLPREGNTSSSDEQKQQQQQQQYPSSTISGIFVSRGVTRTELEPPIASAGDIVTLSGVPDTISVGDTLTLKSNPIESPLETPPIAPPTLCMEIGANTGPLAGKEGTIVASSRVRDRLYSETDNNVTLTCEKSLTGDADRTTVKARGELQLGILIEQMRREGFEMTVTPPKIITTKTDDGRELEPYEEVTIDVDSEYGGTVVNALTGSRKGLLIEMSDSADGKTRLTFEVPSRGLLGFGGEIATLTRGSAVVNHLFLENRDVAGHIGGIEKGKIVSNDTGKAALYALANIAKRGELFIGPGEIVYPGMIIGESSRAGDMEVNPVRGKEATNVRTVNKDEKLYVPPPKRLSVEELIGYMAEDEIIEVTPQSVRLRKAELDAGARERAARSKKKKMMAANSNNKSNKKR